MECCFELNFKLFIINYKLFTKKTVHLKIIYTSIYISPIGKIILGDFEGKLVLADWQFRKMRTAIDKRLQQNLDAPYVEHSTNLLKNVEQQLNDYFNGNLQSFDIPLLMVGSDFQQQVWKQLLQISFGKTMSYLDLAKRMNNEKAIRAVATANGANAISIIIPCHRIIGSDGSLVGYAGGLTAKKKLLELEKSFGQLELGF